MSSWLQSFAARLAGGSPSNERSEQISEIFYKQSLYADSQAFFTDLLTLFPNGADLSTTDLAVLIDRLCGVWGAQKALSLGELATHTAFWGELAKRSHSAPALACYADALFCAGANEEAMEAFASALAAEPELVAELDDDHFRAAQDLRPASQLHFKLAVLRAQLAAGADAEDDSARELYSELLEDFAGDRAAIKQIRALGDALEAAVRSGQMPRALVRRRSESDRS